MDDRAGALDAGGKQAIMMHTEDFVDKSTHTARDSRFKLMSLQQRGC